MLNVLHTNASQVAALDLGYGSSIAEIKDKQPQVLLLLGADDAGIKKEDFPNTFIIYLGLYTMFMFIIHIIFFTFSKFYKNFSTVVYFQEATATKELALPMLYYPELLTQKRMQVT